ncbi:MAG TPA: DUF4173 domain-containing protein, partial [Chitinophagaceae bacterium]|nr:DUF4173 domain-containing protein [Chitinophagaceae bacterium]
VFSFLVSILAFTGKNCALKNSIVAAAIFTAFNLAKAPFEVVIRSYRWLENTGNERRKKLVHALSGGVVALVLGFVFLLLYRCSNPLFNDYVGSVSFEWLDIGWWLFALFSCILVYGLTSGSVIPIVVQTDERLQADLMPQNETRKNGADTATITAVALFSLLNLMLLLMNFLDLQNIFRGAKLPAGLTLADFVHEAVFSLVASTFIAIALVMLFFRGALNFGRYSGLVKVLVYIWIFQNILVIVNAGYRNLLYIDEYQLSRLRIGVFVFLFFCLASLCLTFFKLRNNKSSWWLFAGNFVMVLLVLVCLSLPNWDGIISRYNISNQSSSKPLDKEYLLQLGKGNLPELLQLYNDGKLNVTEKKQFFRKVMREYRENRFQRWPSYNFRSAENNQVVIRVFDGNS